MARLVETQRFRTEDDEEQCSCDHDHEEEDDDEEEEEEDWEEEEYEEEEEEEPTVGPGRNSRPAIPADPLTRKRHTIAWQVFTDVPPRSDASTSRRARCKECGEKVLNECVHLSDMLAHLIAKHEGIWRLMKGGERYEEASRKSRLPPAGKPGSGAGDKHAAAAQLEAATTAVGSASYASVMELLEEYGMPKPLAKEASTKAQKQAMRVVGMLWKKEEDIQESILKGVVGRDWSLSTVHCESFRELLTSLNPIMGLPDGEVMMGSIKANFFTGRAVMREKIRELGRAPLSLSVSLLEKRHLVISAHWLTDTWQPMHVTLKCPALDDRAGE